MKKRIAPPGGGSLVRRVLGSPLAGCRLVLAGLGGAAAPPDGKAGSSGSSCSPARRRHAPRHSGRREGHQRPGQAPRFTVQITDDPRKFDADHLSQFRAVVFLNTSGDALTDDQQAAFEDYYHAGGGFVGIGSASTPNPIGRSSPRSSAPGPRSDRRPDGNDQGRRPRPRRVEGPSRVLDQKRRLVQLRGERPRREPRPRDRRGTRDDLGSFECSPGAAR